MRNNYEPIFNVKMSFFKIRFIYTQYIKRVKKDDKNTSLSTEKPFLTFIPAPIYGPV